MQKVLAGNTGSLPEFANFLISSFKGILDGGLIRFNCFKTNTLLLQLWFSRGRMEQKVHPGNCGMLLEITPLMPSVMKMPEMHTAPVMLMISVLLVVLKGPYGRH